MCAITQNWRIAERKMNGCLSTEKGHIMNIKLIGTCLIAGAQILSVTAYAADSDTDRSSGRAFVKDSVITTKVKAELAKEKPSTLVKVSVDTDKSGIVVLSGTAKSQFDKDRAEAIARNVSGVKMVENNIAIKADQ